LKGTSASYRGRDTTLASRTCEVTLDTVSLDPAQGWVTVQHALNVDKDSVTRLRLNAGIHSKYRPYSLFVTYSTGKGRFRDISTGLPAEITGRSVSYFWYSFPDTLIDVPLTCTLSGVDSLTETVEATFTQQVVPLKLQKEHSTTISRTIVRRTTVLHGPEQGRN
jgi:hypothetical protein